MLERLLLVVCFLPLPSSLQGQACTPPVKFAPTVKAPIRNVIFSNAGALPQEKKLEIVNLLRDHDIDPKKLASEVSGLDDETVERVRAAYQDEGYFKVQVASKAVRVVSDNQQYDVVVQVRSVGRQYRLGDLNIANATRFPAQQLRDSFPIQRGEIFNRERIAAGLEALRRLYGTEGYINYTSVPNTDFDDDNAIANLTIDVDEGKQFHLSSIEVLGVDAETKARVISELDMKSGDIYTSEAWARSLLKFGDVAEDPNPDVVHKKLDERNGWVDMVLDFRKPRICGSTYSGPPRLSNEEPVSAK